MATFAEWSKNKSNPTSPAVNKTSTKLDGFAKFMEKQGKTVKTNATVKKEPFFNTENFASRFWENLKSAPAKMTGLAGEMAVGLARPVVKEIATPFVSGYKQIKHDIDKGFSSPMKPEDYTTTLKLPESLGGDLKLGYTTNIKEAAGRGLELYSTLSPGVGAAKGVIGGAYKQAAKEGFKYGFLGGSGAALTEDKTVPEALVSGLKSGALSMVLGLGGTKMTRAITGANKLEQQALKEFSVEQKKIAESSMFAQHQEQLLVKQAKKELDSLNKVLDTNQEKIKTTESQNRTITNKLARIKPGEIDNSFMKTLQKNTAKIEELKIANEMVKENITPELVTKAEKWDLFESRPALNGKIKPKINKYGAAVTKEFADASANFKDVDTALGGLKLTSGTSSVVDAQRMAEKVDDTGMVRDVMYDKIDDAVANELDFINEYEKDLANLGIAENSKESRNIANYVEGGGKTKVTARELQTATWMSNQYKELLKTLNETLVYYGREPIAARENYMPHLVELNNFVDNFGTEALLGRKPNITTDAALASLYSKPIGPQFASAKARTGGVKVNPDAIGNFRKYINNAARILHELPAIVNARKHLEFLPPNASLYFANWLDNLSGKRPKIDNGFFGSFFNLGAVKKLRGWFARGVIPGNLHTAMLQPSSFAPVIKDAGVLNAFKGYARVLGGLSKAGELSRELKFRTFSESLPDNLSPVSKSRNFLGMKTRSNSLYNSVMDIKDESLTYLMKEMDRFMVAGAWESGYLKAKQMGLNMAESVKFADRLSVKTQAGYRQHQLPPLLQSAVGKNVGQFQAYAFNLMNFLGHDIPRNAMGKKSLNATVKNALTFLAAAMITDKIYEATLNEKIYMTTNIIPFLGQGGKFGSGPVGQGASNLFTIATGTEYERDKAKKDLQSFGFNAIMGAAGLPGSQTSKSLQGIEAVNKGGVYNDKGKLLFRIITAKDKQIALLFGPWATDAADEYMKKQQLKYK